MSTVSQFLEYWQAAIEEEDDAKLLYQAHIDAVADLEASRAQTLRYIQPTKNSKGTWVVGFASNKVDEVVALASEISDKEAKIESICHAIEAFLLITDGQPTFRSIVEKRSQARGAIGYASRSAQAMREREAFRNPRMTLAELSVVPEIVEAEANLTAIRQANEPIIEELTSKLSEIHKIVGKYEKH